MKFSFNKTCISVTFIILYIYECASLTKEQNPHKDNISAILTWNADLETLDK